MKLTHTPLENKLLQLLTQGIPDPKYPLWTTVITEEGIGQVVGYFWKSVDEAFQSQSNPGWYYHIRTRDEVSVSAEDDLEVQ